MLLKGQHMQAANPDSIDQKNGYNVKRDDILVENAANSS